MAESETEPGLAAAATGPVFWSAMAAGGVLIALGFASLKFSWVDYTTSQLVLCSGLGILFGAFGSMATINYKGVVIAGVAAVAVVLLGVVNYLIKDDYVRIRISGGDVKDANRVDMHGARSFHGAQDHTGYEFIVLRADLRLENVGVLIDFLSREYIFECVESAQLVSRLGSTETVEWRFDKERGVLRERGTVIARVGPCETGEETGPSVGSATGSFFLGSAFAQGVADVKTLLADLESNSSAVRREARAALAKLGPAIIQPLADELTAPRPSYRKRLGIVVALTEMLREHKDKRVEIGATLSEEALRLLTEAAGDPDRTVRVYASEFLYDLGDPRSVDMAFRVFKSADDNGKYNVLLVVKGAYPYLSDEQRKQADQVLGGIYREVGRKTQALIREINPDLGA